MSYKTTIGSSRSFATLSNQQEVQEVRLDHSRPAGSPVRIVTCPAGLIPHGHPLSGSGNGFPWKSSASVGYEENHPSHLGGGVANMSQHGPTNTNSIYHSADLHRVDVDRDTQLDLVHILGV